MTDFNKFYQPFFITDELEAIPVQIASIENAKLHEFRSVCNFDQIEDCSLNLLIKKHIHNLPKSCIFVTSGSKSDLLDRAIRPLMQDLRPDIQFVAPKIDLSAAWLDENVPKYFISNPWMAHVIYTMELLVHENNSVGYFGSWPYVTYYNCRYIVQDSYDNVTLFKFGTEYQDFIIPNFTLPFLRATLKESRNILKETNGEELLFRVLNQKADYFPILHHEKSSGSWYKQLINRNWQQPSISVYKDL
jgi:hypothetical protein